MGRPWATACSTCGSTSRKSVYRKDGTLKQTMCRPCNNKGTIRARKARRLREGRGTPGPCESCGDVVRSRCRDHNHQTGKIRGRLCNACNMALGFVRDDPKRLRALITYLERTDG